MKALNYQGYLVLYSVLNAADYGVPQSRLRYYIMGYLVSSAAIPFQGDIETVKFPAWWHMASTLLTDMRIDPLPVEAFLLPEGHCKLNKWRNHKPVDKMAEEKRKETTKKWQVDHLQGFEEKALKWPPCFRMHSPRRQRTSPDAWQKLCTSMNCICPKALMKGCASAV